MSRFQLPKVVSVVLNWNNPQDTLACLDSLKQLDYPNHQVLVIDNGSIDNSVVILAKSIPADPQFALLTTGKNLGFSGGANYGIAAALQLEAVYIWLLNNDTEVAPDCLSVMVHAMEQQAEVGIAGCKIFLQSQREIIWHAGATFRHWVGQPLHYGMGADRHDPRYLQNRVVDYVTGCSLLIRKAVIDTVGKMDDRFYLYYEEADLCYRARQQGWQILYVADAKMWHKVAGSSSGFHERTYYEVRNRLLFTRKHRSRTLPFVVLYLALQELLKPLLKGNFRVARFAAIGFFDFLRNKFGSRHH